MCGNYFFLPSMYLYTKYTAPTTMTNTIKYGTHERFVTLPPMLTAPHVNVAVFDEVMMTPIKAKNMITAIRTSKSLPVKSSMISPAKYFLNN